jgi:hypothetical protein
MKDDPNQRPSLPDSKQYVLPPAGLKWNTAVSTDPKTGRLIEPQTHQKADKTPAEATGGGQRKVFCLCVCAFLITNF